MSKKKKSVNKSGYPDEAIKSLARCFYPSMMELVGVSPLHLAGARPFGHLKAPLGLSLLRKREFFNSEEGQREYEEWLKEQEALNAAPIAA